jgi:hypothetical protein
VSLACWCYFVDEQGLHTPLEVVAHLPCCLTTLGGSTLLTCGFDPLLAVSGALRGLHCKKAEVPSTPCIILGMGSEQSLLFSSMV